MAQTFDPYGNPYAYAGPTESVARYGYSGEQTDSNGLVFLRARYYAPSMGRFFQLDPSRQEQNPYVYAMGNPINYVDPSGLCWRAANTTSIQRLICIDAWEKRYGPRTNNEHSEEYGWSVWEYELFKTMFNRLAQEDFDLPSFGLFGTVMAPAAVEGSSLIPALALVLLLLYGCDAISDAIDARYPYDRGRYAFQNAELTFASDAASRVPPLELPGYGFPEFFPELYLSWGYEHAVNHIISTYGNFDPTRPAGIAAFAYIGKVTGAPLAPTIPPMVDTGKTPIPVGPILVGVRGVREDTGSVGYILMFQAGQRPVGIVLHIFEGITTNVKLHLHVATSKRGASTVAEFMREILERGRYGDEPAYNGDTHVPWSNPN